MDRIAVICVTDAALHLSYSESVKGREGGRRMNALLVLVLIAIFLAAYGVLTYSLYIAELLEVSVFEKLQGFFKKKGGSAMMIPRKLTQFLKKNKVYYQVLVHPPAFTSPETAHAGHIPGKALAKVVMAAVGGTDAMVVVPSNRTVDMFKLSTALGTNDVHIEEEKEFKDLFRDCELGAMPPFGPLYHMPCYVDEGLKENKRLYFNAGNHEGCLEISTEDFLRVVKGIVGDFSVEGKKIHEKGAVAV